MGKIMNLGGTVVRQIYFQSQMQPVNMVTNGNKALLLP